MNTNYAPLAHGGVFDIIEYGSCSLVNMSVHDRGVLFICVNEGSLRVDGYSYEKQLSKGDVMVMSLGRGYRLSNDGFIPCDITYIVADGSIVYDLMRLYKISDFFSSKAFDAFEAVDEIISRMDGGELDGSGDCATAFHRFIFKIKKASQLGGNGGGTALEIRNYIDAHLDGKLTLDELSKMFFVSKTQIFRIFKNAYGIAPMQYFLSKKVELSKKMLSQGHMKISEVAEALAFTDAKHFSKTFKRFTGELPKEYKHRGASDLN